MLGGNPFPQFSGQFFQSNIRNLLNGNANRENPIQIRFRNPENGPVEAALAALQENAEGDAANGAGAIYGRKAAHPQNADGQVVSQKKGENGEGCLNPTGRTRGSRCCFGGEKGEDQVAGARIKLSLLKPGEVLRAINTDTGEMAYFRFRDGGVELINETTAEVAGASKEVAVRSGESFAFESVSGEQSLRVEVRAGSGMDWDVRTLGGEGPREIHVSSVSYGSDYVNIINEDTGEQTSFYLGCLIQQDHLAASGDDVATIRVRNGDKVFIEGTHKDGDNYQIEAGGAGFEVERADAGRGWYFYTGNQVVNVKNAETGKTTSFQVGADGSLTQLDELVEEKKATTYVFKRGDVFNFQVGGHSQPITAQLLAGANGDWQIVGSNEGEQTLRAQLGEGDVIKVMERHDPKIVAFYRMTAGGTLEEFDGAGIDADAEVTAYSLQKGKTLLVYNPDFSEPVKVLEGQSEGGQQSAPGAARAQQGGAPGPHPAMEARGKGVFEISLTTVSIEVVRIVEVKARVVSLLQKQVESTKEMVEKMKPKSVFEKEPWEIMLERLKRFDDIFPKQNEGRSLLKAMLAALNIQISNSAEGRRIA